MLQQRVKYMRIIPITSTISRNPQRITTMPAGFADKTVNREQSTSLPFMPAGYFVNFRGYKEDFSLIDSIDNELDNTIGNAKYLINKKFDNNFDNHFTKALNIIENDELFSKVTRNSEIFNKIAEEFEIFDRTILGSMDEVRFSKKHYTPFWENHSKIGQKLTSEIIREAADAPEARINKLIKQSNDDDYKKIKNSLIKSWFSSVVKEYKPDNGNYPVEENKKSLAELTDKNYAEMFVKNEKINLFNSFNSRTINKIMLPSASDEQKLEAGKLMLSYVEKKLLEDKGEKLKADFDKLYSIKEQLAYAKEKESLFFAKSALKMLHSLAFEKWEKDNLQKTLNTKLEKEIFTKKEEQSNKKLHYFQNYPNFDSDTKYFTARYYNARYLVNNIYDYDGMDYLLQIINDRHNTKTPQEVIKNIATTLDENKNVYFNQLDNFYDFLRIKQYNPEINLPVRSVQTPNDKLSFVDLYIEKLGVTDKFKRCSEKEKINYLASLTREEFELINKEIKNEWLLKDEKYAILDEVSRQAKSTSVFLGMYEELKKININLEDIKIKTNAMTVTLKDVLENRTVISSSIQEDTNIKLSSQISELQRQYNNSSPQQQAVIDKKFTEAIPAIINLLRDGQKDSGLDSQLMELSKVAKGKNSTNKTLEFVKNMLIARTVAGGLSSSKKYLGKQLLANKLQNPQMPDLSPVDVVADAGAGAAGAGMLTQLGTVVSAHPVAAAVAAVTLIAGGGAIISSHKAANAEKSQRTLDFYVEI